MNRINLSGTTLTFPVTPGEVVVSNAVCGKGNTCDSHACSVLSMTCPTSGSCEQAHPSGGKCDEESEATG